ncbi:hypothetical protein BDY24DRAFT_383287 [Mrakia frigida]|uniref:uncharacterized protein n=1 Tax=Mrakia frigida TaxID=29902 RepID=UPI003FCBFDEE
MLLSRGLKNPSLSSFASLINAVYDPPIESSKLSSQPSKFPPSKSGRRNLPNSSSPSLSSAPFEPSTRLRSFNISFTPADAEGRRTLKSFETGTDFGAKISSHTLVMLEASFPSLRSLGMRLEGVEFYEVSVFRTLSSVRRGLTSHVRTCR